MFLSTAPSQRPLLHAPSTASLSFRHCYSISIAMFRLLLVLNRLGRVAVYLTALTFYLWSNSLLPLTEGGYSLQLSSLNQLRRHHHVQPSLFDLVSRCQLSSSPAPPRNPRPCLPPTRTPVSRATLPTFQSFQRRYSLVYALLDRNRSALHILRTNQYLPYIRH